MGFAFLFGGLFVAAGTPIILIGTKILEVDPATVHAPYWVLTVCGTSFALAGFWIWNMAWRQFAAERRRREVARRFPDETALADYPWHPDGFEVSEWAEFIKALALALGLTVFLSMFNWWAFFLPNAPWMLKGIVGLFDVATLLMWLRAAQKLGCALKFGHSRIEFVAFPYHPPNPVELRWQPFKGIDRVNKGTFTLRCVEEWMESRGHGENRNLTLVHEEVWSASGFFDQPRHFQLRENVELRYELPPSALPTNLSADKPLFWELEVKLDLSGLDFKETYLVPVYGRSGSQDQMFSPPMGKAPNTGK